MPQKGPESEGATSKGQHITPGGGFLGQGMDLESIWQVFVQHRHNGTVLDGQPVRAVFLADAVNGHVYQLVVKNGVLGVQIVS